MEKEVSDSRKMAKYNAIVAKALYITDAQAQEAAANSADKADISYIVKNYSTIEDSTINVSNGEIKEYYNKHQKSFEQPESRKIVYVNFDIEPSGEDFSETEGAVNDLVKEFEESADPLEFVNLSSEQKADRNYFKQDEIANDSMAQFLFNNEKAVFGPYLENNAYKISRVASVKMLPDSVRARHILIAPQNQDYAQAKNIADSLAGLLRKGADFEELAKTNSVDQNSAVNGGDLGWFTSRTMVQPFSDSAFFAKKNDIKVVLTQYGAHVLQVTDMAKPVKKIQIATVEKEVSPSAKTTNQIYNDARTFAIEVSNLDNFNKKVEESGLTKRIATIGKNDKTIAGMESAREMIRQFQQLEELMQNQGQSSTLKLGSTLTVGTCLTPSIILDLQKKIPDLDVYSFVTNTQNIEQKLLRSELDAAVVEGEIHSPDLVVLPIIDDCLVLAAGKKHPFYRRGRIHVQELNNQKFAVREYGSGTRQLFEDYTLRHDLKIRTAWEANSPQALLNAVLYNQMLSVMSIRLMHHEIRHRSVRVFCNEAGEWNRKFKLVYHKNKFLTPAIFELEKILHTYQQLELPSVMGVLEQE